MKQPVFNSMANFLDTQTTCPICSSGDITPAFHVNYWRDNVFKYSDCHKCGATFANPMPSDELISKGNDALVRHDQHERTMEQEFREARQAYLRGKLLARKLTHWKRKGKLLELGCYHGFFSLGVRENSNWEVEGLEISTELCSFMKNILGINCYLGTLEKASLPDNHFDFIVCHDLIEHINQPKVFLEKLNSILATGGRVQIITPNAKQDLAFTRRAYASGKPITMLLNHIMYFRTGTMKLALENAGLKPIRLYCYDIRYALRDFGCLGMGKPGDLPTGPSIENTLKLNAKKTLGLWTPQKLDELRHHKKTSLMYGLIKETLPRTFTLHMPYKFEIGHEIYALAEKQ